jgi:iron uptake system EfeUOB component EfeO/EfeM
VSRRKALKNACVGALLVLAAIGLGAVVAACGGGGEEHVYHPISTVSARPDVKITAVTGGANSPQVEALLAEERTGNPGPGSDLEPLAPSRFRRPVAEYRAYSVRQARGVGGAVRRLRAALAAGDVAAARRAWLDAYDHYLRLGAAYGALGKLDEEIDGDPGRLPGGTRSPEFTGLHRIEMGLWTGEAPAELRAPAAYLAAKVARLQTVVRTIRIGPTTYATRAHEILEDAQRDMLSGVDAPWSGAGLRATYDSLLATEFVVDTLRPLLNGRDSTIEPVETEDARLQEALAQVRREHGGEWPRLAAMTASQHRLVDGRLGAALERLDAIPGALEVARAQPAPTIAEQKRERGR